MVRLTTGKSGDITLQDSPPPLVGREREFGVLDDMLLSAATGEGQLVLVEGEWGIGKTRLLDELCELAARRGFVVVRAGGERTSSDLPFGLLSRFSRAASDSGVPPRNRHESLSWMNTLVGTAPVLLVVDDAHWVDRASLYALADFSRQHASERVALVVGYSPRVIASQDCPITEALAEHSRLSIRLSGLAHDAMTTLTTEVFGMPPGEGLRDQIGAVGGNPLLGIELLRGLHAEELLTVEDGHVEMHHGDLPERLRTLLLQPVRRLSPSAMRTLRVAAVLGRRFRVAHLALMTAKSTAELLPALDELILAGVLDEDDDRLAFRNRLLRRALYNDIPAAIRASLHLDAGLRLRDSGSSIAEVGHHLALGALPGDHTAVTLLAEAAHEAARTAPPVAVELFDRALAVTSRTAPEREPLFAGLINASLWCGRIADAARISQETLTWSHTPAATTALGVTDCLRGRATVRSLDPPAHACAPPSGSADEARALAQDAWRKLLDSDLRGAQRVAKKAWADGEEAGDDFAVCAAMAAEELLDLAGGRPHRALDLARRQLGRVTAAESGASLWPAHLFLATALRELDRFEEAESALRDGNLRAVELGARLNEPFYQAELADVHHVAGYRQKALHAAHRALELATEMGANLLQARVHALLAEIYMHDNDLRASHRELGAAESRLDGEVWPVSSALLHTKACLAEADSNTRKALALHSENWTGSLQAGTVTRLIELAPAMARLCRRTGDRRRAVQITRQLSEAVSGSAVAVRPRTRCALLCCQASALDEPDLPRRAAAMSRAVHRPWIRAATCEEMGTQLAEQHSNEEAIELLKESMGLYRRLAATRDVARTKSALRRLGVRTRRTATRPERRPPRSPALTAAEREVLVLLTQGLTNRKVASQLFVSPRTVETHISHMFAKLDVSSRTALVTAARERNLLTGSAAEEDG